MMSNKQKQQQQNKQKKKDGDVVDDKQHEKRKLDFGKVTNILGNVNLNVFKKPKGGVLTKEDERNEDEFAYLNEMYGYFRNDSSTTQKALLTPQEDAQLRKVLQSLNLPVEEFHSSHSLLSRKLAECEKENIHAILLSQNSWKEVNDSLFVCEKMLNEMKTWVERYNRKLMIMQKGIEQIERENNALEVMYRNHNSLLKELDSLTESLKFDETYVNCILNDDFDGSENLSKINKACLKLQETLNRPFADGMNSMDAVIKRKREFSKLRFALVNRFREFLCSRLTKQAEEIIRDRAKNSKKFDIVAKQVTEKDNLNKQIYELHRDKVHKALDKYETLMICTYSTQIALEGDPLLVEAFAKEINDARKALKKNKGLHIKFNLSLTKEKKGKCQSRADQLTQVKDSYCSSISPLYRKEFSDFTLDTKAVLQRLRDNKHHNSFLLSVGKKSETDVNSVNKTTVASATSTSTNMTDTDDLSDDTTTSTTSMSTSHALSLSDYKLETPDTSCRVDCVFAYCMNTVCDVIYTEQSFCSKFFLRANKQDNPQIDIHAKFLYEMLDKIFRDIASQLLTLFEWVRKKCDSFYLLSMTLTLERLQTIYKEKSPFLNNVILSPLLDMTKQSFEKFVANQLASIDEYKCVIKKTSVVPFLAKFPYWAKRFELILERQQQQTQEGTNKNVMAYTANRKIAAKMFEHIERLSETEKKHADSFRVKQYMFFISSMQQNPDMQQGLLPIAQERLNKYMDDYIKMMIEWKFEDLFTYFAQLENTMRTVDIDDIVYQTQYSKKKLKDLIQRYCKVQVTVNMDQTNLEQFSDFKQKLVDIYLRMDKHLGLKCESSSSFKIGTDFMKSVLQLVWEKLRQYFVKRFEEMHELVLKCYKDTNIIFVPTVPVVERLFNQVEDEKVK